MTAKKPDPERMRSTREVLPFADCLYSAEAIDAALDLQARRLSERLEGKAPLVLCVMQGGLVYTANLIKRLDCLLELDYLHATRYRNTTQGSELQWKSTPSTPLQQRVVLVLDDILDEGHTLSAIIDYCRSQGAAQVYAAVLLLKQHDRREKALAEPLSDIDYALTVPDRYVFGYGMDFQGRLRQLDCIYALKE